MPTVLVHPFSASTLLIETRSNMAYLSTGTGFLVRRQNGKPALVTARHVVTGRHHDTGAPLSVDGRVPDEIKVPRVTGVSQEVSGRETMLINTGEPFLAELYAPGSVPLWVEHPTWGSRVDVVALPLDEDLGQATTPFFGPGAPAERNLMVAPGETVSVIGYPFGISVGATLGLWVTGTIASEPGVEFAGLPQFVIDCRTREGQSGSPVVALRSGWAVIDGQGRLGGGPYYRFLGVYTGRIRGDSDLGLVWKANVVAEILAELNRCDVATA